MAQSLRAGASALALLLASPALAQDAAGTYNFFGTPGLLEMPSAVSAPEGEIAGTSAGFGGQIRNSFTFQVTDRLSGTFRYAGIEEFLPGERDLWDRSFDLRFRFNDEGRVMPAVAVGFQDFLGTGVYSAEYIVATKTLGDAFRVTAGLGWGRLGTANGFTNPLAVLSDRFETRPDPFVPGEDQGGTPGLDTFFRGDAAVFGGIEWAPTERLVFKAEYSSDNAYLTSGGEELFEIDSPLNFGVSWRPAPGIQLHGAYMYGTQLALGATITINPNNPPFGNGLDPAPQPVAVRADALRAAQSWDRAALPEATLRDRLALALRTEGVELAGLELSDRSARLRYTNTRFRSEAQAFGRILRILTQELPPSIEILTLEPMQRGIPLSSVSFRRSDIEAYENEVGGSLATLSNAGFDDAGPAQGLDPVPLARDPFTWGIRPYFGLLLFDAEDNFQLKLGAEVSAAYRIQPNLILSGAVRQELLDTGSGIEEEPEPIGGVPVVRRNFALYGQDGGPTLENLTLTHYGRPGTNLYSRASVGYLEPMYGGVSGELLYKPVESRLALGVEVNYVVQRDYDQLFEFREYDVVTGHASAYYDFGNGFLGQIDAGRYLAGDWGASFALDREFENGWSIGGYFTLTEIPFEDFGEGSFDKGIRVSIPTDFLLGQPSRRELSSTLRSLNRDGGARLELDGRLYDTIRDGHLPELDDTWGRFWR